MRISLLILLLLSTLLLGSCTKQLHLVKSDPRYYRVDNEIQQPASTSLDGLLEPYQQQYAKTMNDVIGKAAITMTKDKPESTLGNWMCDVLLEKAQAVSGVITDVAYQNYGGIRIPELAKGDISRGKIYELMPFDNMLVIVEMPGEQMLTFINGIAESGGKPVSHTLRMQIVDGRAERVSIGGEPFDPSRTYHVAMPDYVANGGDRSDYLVGLKRYDTGLFIRDLLLEGVEQSESPIQAKLDGRVAIKNN